MKHIRYSLMSAHMNNNESRHPQVVMEELGITYQHSTPQSISDSWWFWNCENVPVDTPEFLSELKADPVECIGRGLSVSDARKIRDYDKEKIMQEEKHFYWGKMKTVKGKTKVVWSRKAMTRTQMNEWDDTYRHMSK